MIAEIHEGSGVLQWAQTSQEDNGRFKKNAPRESQDCDGNAVSSPERGGLKGRILGPARTMSARAVECTLAIARGDAIGNCRSSSI